MTSSKRTVCAFFALVAASFAAAQGVKVEVDGIRVNFAGTQPREVNNRVLVPLRGVFEQMGADVTWRAGNHTVIANRGSDRVALRIGERTATVNGRPVDMDVPAMIVDGSTMVPLRFVSEALGAQVGWFAADQLVTISTTTTSSGSSTYTSQPQRLRRVVVTRNTIIPVRLETRLTSTANRKGDTFTATVDTQSGDEYSTIPEGSKIEGHIAAVQRMRNGNPALMDLSFDRLRLPNGRAIALDGSLVSLNADYVTRNSNGVLVIDSSAPKSQTDKRMVYAGYGAGAGLLVGLLTKKPLEGTILGGAIGYLIGQVQKDQRAQVSDITLEPGTEMGVRLNEDLSANWLPPR